MNPFDEALAAAHAAQQRSDGLRADLAHLRKSRWYPIHAAFPRRAAWRVRESFDRDAWSELQTLWKRRTAVHPLSEQPLVSVVIPVYNHVNTTVRCLTSIALSWFETLPVEIILVDDGSRDETALLHNALDGLRSLKRGRNQGFIAACNDGAAIARGRYVCFLNNDTSALDGWLDALVTLLESDGSIGAAGSKLLYPDGRLAEAGGIIYADGTGENYGRGGDPSDPRYNYRRDVDYCSGASLIVRRELFDRLGGFDRRYEPAYYEDADLCFAIREAGLRVVYQPASVVIHDEGTTAGTDDRSGVKRFQTRNRARFFDRWQKTLRDRVPPSPQASGAAARRIRTGKVVLVIDSYVPLHDREAGSKRLAALVHIMRDLGYHVVFLPHNYAAIQPYARELEACGIEVLYHVDGGRSKEQAIDEILPLVDVAWICRPELFDAYYDTLRRNTAIRFIYDTIDLHFVRERREAELGLAAADTWQTTRERELNAARRAATVITVTDEERAVLVQAGIQNVVVVPTVHERYATDAPPFSARAGVLFIGNYNHTPNVDAARWLCREIMPLVWQANPTISLTLLGSNPTPEVEALASERVAVPGYVPDVSPYFQSHRVFAAPLRYGAGLKGKIGESLAYGLPVVTTAVGAEGFAFVDERDCLLAETPEAFARALLRIYDDEALWNRLAGAADTVLAPCSPKCVAETIHAVMR
jgi:GT2 family glycosyltransferase